MKIHCIILDRDATVPDQHGQRHANAGSLANAGALIRILREHDAMSGLRQKVMLWVDEY